MKNPRAYPLIIAVTAALVFGCAAADLSLATVDYMSPEDLLTILDNPEVIVLDVRTGRDWSSAEFKIRGAVRVAPEALSGWVDRFPKEKTLVLY
jgi:hypothetical protein